MRSNDRTLPDRTGRRTWSWRTAALALSLALVVGLPARAGSTREFSGWSLQVGTSRAQGAGDDGTALADVHLAGVWIDVVQQTVPGALQDGRDALDEIENRIAITKAERRAKRRDRRRVDRGVRRLESFERRLEDVRENLDAFASADTSSDGAAALAKAAKRATHVEVLAFRETHSAWDHILFGLDHVAETLLDEIQDAEDRFRLAPEAGSTRAGRKFEKVLEFADRLAQRATGIRTDIVLLDEPDMKANFTDDLVPAQKRQARRMRQAVKQYGDFVRHLSVIQDRIRRLVARALTDVLEPETACPSTFPDEPDRGGGYIEIAIGDSVPRRYPATVGFSQRGGLGSVVIGGRADGGPFDGDFLSLALNDTALSGEGTYSFTLEGELVSPDKALFTFDTRGEDGDPYTDNNFSYKDWERDVVSGSLTITKVDLTKAGRALEGSFTLETAFLDNPEDKRAEATIKGTFKTCGFLVVRQDGTFDFAD